MATDTSGYEAEPIDVAAETRWLRDFPDPLERYQRATAAQAHHEAVVSELARVRDAAIVQMHDSGLSYGKIGELVGLSRGRVQQFIERRAT